MKKATTYLFIILISLVVLSSCCKTVADPPSESTGEIIDGRDGKKYKWVRIGNQIWFSQNLNYGTIIDGSQSMSNNDVPEKYCFNNDTLNCNELGGLYQWKEMMNYEYQEKSKGLCPEGWHIPSDSEWVVLESYVDSIPDSIDVNWLSTGYRGYQVGKYLKSNLNWVNNKGEDKYGFKAFGAGIRVKDPNYFGDLFNLGYYWTSTTYYPVIDSNVAWIRIIDASNDLVSRKDGAFKSGRSVRCIKN